MVASAGDLVRLALALRPSGPLLRPESYAEMLAEVVLRDGKPCRIGLPGAEATYGYGLEIVRFDDLAGHRAIGKSGVFPGYSSYFAAFEGTDLALAAFSDADDSLAFTVETVHEVAKLLLARRR
jgi:CubicO group peptidase (beta-lactamase class C family)